MPQKKEKNRKMGGLGDSCTGHSTADATAVVRRPLKLWENVFFSSSHVRTYLLTVPASNVLTLSLICPSHICQYDPTTESGINQTNQHATKQLFLPRWHMLTCGS